jgi:uncharacterized membrane protein
LTTLTEAGVGAQEVKMQGERMSQQVPSTENQAGLSENAAGGLAYALVIPAIIFLLVEPYNKSSYIRFHSWQCIYMAVAWMAIDVVIFILGSFPTALHLISFGLYPLVALAMLILWIMVLLKALNGERFKLPVIGDMAEKQANG